MKEAISRILLGILFLAVGLCAQTPPVTNNDKIYLGFLDDAREEMVNWKSGVARQRIIRPAFERTHLGWKEVDSSSLPHCMKWTIAFDGSSLGQVKSQVDSREGLTSVQTILASSEPQGSTCA